MFGEEVLDVPGKLTGLVNLRSPRLDPFQAEIVDHLLYLPLLVVELEVHQAGISSRAITTRCTWLVPS